MSQKELKIGLLWHSLSSQNLGVGALTLSHIDILRAIAKSLNREVRFSIFGIAGGWSYADLAPDVASVDIVSRNALVNPWSSFHRSTSQCDIVFDICGGDSFTDIYGLKRFTWMALTKLNVIFRGIPLVLAPQTFGPFKGSLTQYIATKIVGRAQSAFSRDGRFDRIFPQLRSKALIVQTTDVAIELRYDKEKYSFENQPEMKVGLNISGLLWNKGYTGENEFSLKADYADLIAKVVAALCEQPGVKLHLVPHVLTEPGTIESDIEACAAMHNLFPDTILAPEFHSPIDAKSYVANLDLMLGSRMHVLIAALSTGVPVLALAYSEKFEGVFSEIGYKPGLDLKIVDAEDVIGTAIDMIENLAVHRQAARSAQQKAIARLEIYKVAVKKILEAI